MLGGTARGQHRAPSRLPSLLQYTGEISTAFEKLTITLSPISLLNQSQRDLLLNASRDGQPPDFTSTLEQVGWGSLVLRWGVQICVDGCTAPSSLLLWESHCRFPGCPLLSVSPLGQLGTSFTWEALAPLCAAAMGYSPAIPRSHGSVSTFSSWSRA